MDDRAFDRAMRMLAARERPPEAGARLAQVLSSLPDAPAPRRRMGRRLVPALAAALLICATAIAAQLGLLSFWETNPYRLFHNRERVRPTLSVRPLDVTDASGLRLTEVSALDAAWIEGRLTLALRVAAKDGQPLTVGLTEEDGILLPDGQDASGRCFWRTASPAIPVPAAWTAGRIPACLSPVSRMGMACCWPCSCRGLHHRFRPARPHGWRRDFPASGMDRLRSHSGPCGYRKRAAHRTGPHRS